MSFEDSNKQNWMEAVGVSQDARRAYSEIKGNQNITHPMDEFRNNPAENDLAGLRAKISTELEQLDYEAGENSNIVNELLQLRANDPDMTDQQLAA